jgi:hypothetical protein
MHAPALDPLALAALVAGTLGAVLLVQARVQSRLLRRRIAAGVGTSVVDPTTGLFSAEAAWQCIRAEANRASRLERPLHLWIGAATDADQLDSQGRELAFSLPSGANGIRIDHRHLCVVSCAGPAATPVELLDSVDWSEHVIAPGEHAAAAAFAAVSEALVA